MIRHCKILSSIIDEKIKTNSGHICKLLRSLHKTENVDENFNRVLVHFLKLYHIDLEEINKIVSILNCYVPKNNLSSYNIKR